MIAMFFMSIPVSRSEFNSTADQTKTRDITLEEIKKIQGFETSGDEELHEIAESIKELALLLNIIPSADQFSNK